MNIQKKTFLTQQDAEFTTLEITKLLFKKTVATTEKHVIKKCSVIFWTDL